MTTQGGSGCRSKPANKRYDVDFAKTSAASAIVAGMVASLSGIWRARFPDGPDLKPDVMRRIIGSSTWKSSAEIGPRANFPDALRALDRHAALVESQD